MLQAKSIEVEAGREALRPHAVRLHNSAFNLKHFLDIVPTQVESYAMLPSYFTAEFLNASVDSSSFEYAVVLNDVEEVPPQCQQP